MKHVLIILTLFMVGCSNSHEVVDCLLAGQGCTKNQDRDDELYGMILNLDQRIVELKQQLRDQDIEFEEIDLCGNGGEVLFRIDRELYAFNAAGRGFLDRLSPGDYITTDGNRCKFTVTFLNEIEYR